MIEPKPPPSRSCATLLEDGFVVLLGGPAREDHDASAVERRLDDVAHALGERAMGTPAFSYAFLASACSMCAVGGFTLMTCAPSWAAICAA